MIALSSVVEMFRDWRFWKKKRRRSSARTRSYSAPLCLSDTHSFDPVAAVTSLEEMWLVEEELLATEKASARLLQKLSQQPDEAPSTSEEECVVCASGRACMQTFPCGHCVLCKKCFIRTIHVAVVDRQLPLKCVVCRSRIAKSRHQLGPRQFNIRKQQSPPNSFPFGSPQGLSNCQFCSELSVSPHPPSGIIRPGYL